MPLAGIDEGIGWGASEPHRPDQFEVMMLEFPSFIATYWLFPTSLFMARPQVPG